MASSESSAGVVGVGRRSPWTRILSPDRTTYWGSLAFNLVAALLPAIYTTLSKLWIANFDASHLATTDVYNYLGVIAETLNDGLPRVSWLVIGDGSTRTPESRLALTFVLVGTQALLGLLLTVALVVAAPRLAQSFVPADIWLSSVQYVRLTAPLAFSSMVQAAISAGTRALDQPDVSAVISASCTLLNIVLDLLLISNFHVGWLTPSIVAQASIRLACNLIATAVGLGYFAWNIQRLDPLKKIGAVRAWPPWPALAVLLPPARWTFLESLTRNAIYLWVISRIVALGHDYATAFGVFTTTVRWGVIMVPASAFYASSLTFVGHRWAEWRHGRSSAHKCYSVATWKDVKYIIEPAMVSTAGALVVEIGICILMTVWEIEAYAYFLSKSETVAAIVAALWRNVEWCYVVFAVGWQVGTILLATSPLYYLAGSVASNVIWMLPWAVVLTVAPLAEADMWRLATIMLGGAVVVDTLALGASLLWWYRRLRKGQVYMLPVTANLVSSNEERAAPENAA